ncbi:unnamed protein product [Meloidogyne enterolobii]|uniref:Uncharacterized protein n=1 Tax=Meloidogyne enterolobii TaxID=390850 RepID=A0ACB1A3U4_MELEN
MSLYEEENETVSKDKEKEDSSQNIMSNKMNLSFLKSQLEAKKALLQKSAAAQNQKNLQSQQQQPPSTPTISSTPVIEQQSNLPEQKPLINLKPQQRSTFKLKTHKAFPLPLDSSGAFSIIPKAFKEDKVFLFGEIMIDDEYNPTAPTDYSSFKQKREQQRLKEKIAKEIADRIAREASEEEEKRKRGAAIAPPTSFMVKEEPQIQQPQPQQQPQIAQHENNEKLEKHFGKGVSRGLGVAATIMSKMGYREGSGLGAKEQGISRALQNWKKCWFNCWRRKSLCCVYKFV